MDERKLAILGLSLLSVAYICGIAALAFGASACLFWVIVACIIGAGVCAGLLDQSNG